VASPSLAENQQPKSSEQLRIDNLKAAKDRAADALSAERQRQQVSRAQKTLAAARQPKPIKPSVL
jgi:hypothetical protein